MKSASVVSIVVICCFRESILTKESAGVSFGQRFSLSPTIRGSLFDPVGRVDDLKVVLGAWATVGLATPLFCANCESMISRRLLNISVEKSTVSFPGIESMVRSPKVNISTPFSVLVNFASANFPESVLLGVSRRISFNVAHAPVLLNSPRSHHAIFGVSLGGDPVNRILNCRSKSSSANI